MLIQIEKIIQLVSSGPWMLYFRQFKMSRYWIFCVRRLRFNKGYCCFNVPYIHTKLAHSTVETIYMIWYHIYIYIYISYIYIWMDGLIHIHMNVCVLKCQCVSLNCKNLYKSNIQIHLPNNERECIGTFSYCPYDYNPHMDTIMIMNSFFDYISTQVINIILNAR